MTLVEACRRVAGLLAFFSKAALAPGKVRFDGTLLAAPSVRLFVARKATLSLGKRVVISYDSDMCAVEGGNIHIGQGVYLGPRCMLSAHDAIRIGDGCLFGPDVKVFDNNHEFKKGIGIVKGRHRSAPVTIGKNVWLGANVVVLKGVDIGDGAVVGAGCIIRSNVPAGAVVGGEHALEAPARGFERP